MRTKYTKLVNEVLSHHNLDDSGVKMSWNLILTRREGKTERVAVTLMGPPANLWPQRALI
jgi:hypothetical protein